MWTCEFCNHKNKVQLEPEECPKNETVSYILEAAPVKTAEEESKTPATPGLAKDISVVFCIDVSGSMSSGRPLSRMECVKKTIIGQINEMKINHPQRKVGLVTFTNEVEIIGDGVANSTIVSGEYLNDYNFLLKTGVACATT